MSTPRTSLNLCILVSSLLLTGAPLKAEEILIQNTSGQSLYAQVLGRNGDNLTIKRDKDGKKFTIPFNSLSEDSKKKVLEQLKILAESYPELEAEVVVGKRRRHDGSYYMKKMEVTSKTILKNTDLNRDCPPCQCHIILVVQNQRYEERFKVISSQKFEITPNNKGAEFESAPISTRYDSDNKGYGNVGGYKYVGYLLIVMDKEGEEVILTSTNYSKIEQAITLDADLIKTFLTYTSSRILGSDMKPSNQSNY